MGRGKVPLIAVRVLALVFALGVVGVGAWCMQSLTSTMISAIVLTFVIAKFIIHDVEIRGTAIIELIRPPQTTEQYWRDYFTTVLNGVTRIWISIAAVSSLSIPEVLC